MQVALQIERRNAALKPQMLVAFAEAAKKAAKLHGTVSILIGTNEQIKGLNRHFRSKNRPTDVISFPASDAVSAFHSGDIAISADIAIDNAARYGHSPADEVKILILHGMLHLAGYDHESDNGKMAQKESKLRKALGLRDSLIARTNSTSKTSAATKKKAATRKEARISKGKKVRASGGSARGHAAKRRKATKTPK
jgi:probable rRNA maturation factor